MKPYLQEMLYECRLAAKIHRTDGLEAERRMSVVGYGRAQKVQVMQMVKVLLNLESVPKPDDAADALAVAICHANSGRKLI